MDIQIDVPEGTSGNWTVEDFIISEEGAKFANLRAAFHPGARYVKPGKFKRLIRGSKTIMSNTPAEINDHSYFIHTAKQAGGNILINGLGLGVCLKAILESEKVEHITVIEKSPDVISLVGPTFENDDRVTIVCGDAFEYKPPKGMRYSAVWHDIWDDICVDNLPEMTKLHRKYGRRTDWQGSWCKELCKRYRDMR